MMGMMGEPKKIATMIVAKPKVEEVSDNETDYSAGMDAAAKDIAQAIEQKDSKLLVSAIKDLFTMLMDEHERGESEEDEEEDEETPGMSKKGWV